jgi:hypothetical protein
MTAITKQQLIEKLEIEYDNLTDKMKRVNLEVHPELILKRMVVKAKLNVLQINFKTHNNANNNWLAVKTHKPPLNKNILVYAPAYYDKAFYAVWDGNYWYDIDIWDGEEAIIKGRKIQDDYAPTHWMKLKLPKNDK